MKLLASHLKNCTIQ